MKPEPQPQRSEKENQAIEALIGVALHPNSDSELREQQPPATDADKLRAKLTADALGYEPATDLEQEWTVDESPPSGMRGRIMIPNRLPIAHWQNDSIDLKVICAAHNAALAAAKEDKAVVMHAYSISQENDRLKQQLAAEREETEGWKRNGANAVAGLERELAAEREKVESQDQLWRGRYNDCWQQLLAAQAAIALVRKWFDAMGDSSPKGRDINLAQLREAVFAVDISALAKSSRDAKTDRA